MTATAHACSTAATPPSCRAGGPAPATPARAAGWAARLLVAGCLALVACQDERRPGMVDGPADDHCLDRAPGAAQTCPADTGGADDDQRVATQARFLVGPTHRSKPAQVGSRHEAGLSVAGGDTASDAGCKYTLRWWADDDRVGSPVRLSLQVDRLSDGQPAIGANPELQILRADGQPTATTQQPGPAEESTPGTYTLKPVTFAEPGRYVLYFHLYGACGESDPATLHAHVATAFEAR